MGNSGEVEKAQTELYLARRKMNKIAKRIKLLLPTDRDCQISENRPFMDLKQSLERSLTEAEELIIRLHRTHPRLVENWDTYHRDFQNLKNTLEKVDFRPDLTDEKMLAELYPAPQLEVYVEESDESALFAEFDAADPKSSGNPLEVDGVLAIVEEESGEDEEEEVGEFAHFAEQTS